MATDMMLISCKLHHMNMQPKLFSHMRVATAGPEMPQKAEKPAQIKISPEPESAVNAVDSVRNEAGESIENRIQEAGFV